MSSTSQEFDIFLSHNSREKALVERIAERLKHQAIEPWFDKWCLTPGGDWQDELADGLRRSSACAVLIGVDGIGDWERLEFKVATDRMAKDRNFRVFLVLLPGLPDPFDTGSLPPFLCTRTWVDLRQGVADPRAFQRLVNAVKGIAPGPESPVASRDDVCPYRGLRAFDEEHAEFFFGREGDVQRIVEKLKSTRFLSIVGASGSGKSSLVRAGLIPALRKGALPGSDAWPVRVFTPGALPLTSMAANIARSCPQSSAVKMLDELGADERALHLATSVSLTARPQSERVVWVVDQFEEVFTLCRDEAERAKFIANLLYAATVPGGRSAVVLTLRADFYQKCAAYPELSAQVSAQQFLVSLMSAEGLRQAIGEPAWRVGLELEQGLVETILDDVESQPGALPLLEHALLELWERRRGRMLTLEAYRETGGVGGAIAKRADAIFEAFDDERQTIARSIMLRLTQPGEGTEDTRRRATMSELITRPDEAEKVRHVITALADARLLTTDSGAHEGSEVVDVSHEALIRGWPRLRRWVEEDREGLRAHRRLTDAAQDWQRSGRDDGLLLRGARLAQMTEWHERNRSAANELEREFLDASVELQARERLVAQLRARRIAVGVAAALVLISAATLYAFIQSRLATRRGSEAFARELAAHSLAQLRINPELSLRLAIEAAQRGRITETENTLRQVLAKSPRHVLHIGTPPSSHVPTATFARGGKLIAVTNDKTLQVFDAETGWKLFNQSYDSSVRQVVSSPGGKFIAVWVIDSLNSVGLIDIRETETSRSVVSLPITTETTEMELVFSPDDKFLVMMWGGQSHVLEVDMHRFVAELEGQSAAFSLDGKLLFTKEVINDGVISGDTLFVTATADWRTIAEIPSTKPSGVADDAAFGAISSDGKHVVARTADGRVRLHESVGGRIVREQKLEGAANMEAAAFSPDGRFVAFALNGSPVIWDTSSEEARELHTDARELRADTHWLLRLSFSPDGRLLLIVDGSARIHDVRSGRILAEYNMAGGGAVDAAEFSPDGQSVLTMNQDGTAFVWDLSVSHARTVLLPESIAPPERPISRMLRPKGTLVSPDGRLVADIVMFEAGQYVARVRDFASGRAVRLLTHDKHVYSIAFSPDSKLILTTDYTTARVWELGSGHMLAQLRHDILLKSAAYSPDGRRLLTVGVSDAKVWNTSDGRLVEELEAEGEVSGATFSPDGGRILITAVGQAHVWELGGGGIVLTMGEVEKFGGGITSAIYSPDARHILTWEKSGERHMANSIQVRNADTGRIVVELNGHVDRVHSATVAPGGEFVVTTSGSESIQMPGEANQVRVWDLRSGSTFCEFHEHGGAVVNSAFNPDGKSFWVADASGAVYVYTCELCAPQDDLLKLAQRRSVRQLTQDERVRYLHESRGN